MYTLKQIQETARKQRAAFSTMEAIVRKMNADIDAERKDKSRTPAYVNERVQMIRDNREAAVREQYQAVLAIGKELQHQEVYWSLKPLVLSTFTFSEDQADDAVIRSNTREEMARMPVKLLNLAGQSAIEEKNY